MRGTLALLDQISLDEVLANVYRICEARSRIAAIVKAALYKPLDGLTLLEQSYIHRAYPARLPSLAQGVECIQNVCEHLISTALSACKPSSLLHLRKVSSNRSSIPSASELLNFCPTAWIIDARHCKPSLEARGPFPST